MSTRNPSDFDDSWLDKSSNEINDLDQLLAEQDAAADDLDELPGDAGEDATLDDAWLEGGEEVVNLSEEDVVAEGAGLSAGALDDAEFEKWLEATAGGTKTADDDLGLSETGVEDDMDKWLRDVVGEQTAEVAEEAAATDMEGAAEAGRWEEAVTGLEDEERTVVLPAAASQYTDAYMRATGMEAEPEPDDGGMAMADLSEPEPMPGDEPFDAERMSLEELTGTGGGGAGRGSDDLDLDAEDELARASAQLGEAFSFDDTGGRDEDAGATGIFYTETMGDVDAPPSLSDDRFPPPDHELDDEERFSFDEPRPRTSDGAGLFERTASGLRERVSEATGAGARTGAEEFTDMGAGEGGGQSNWLLVALAGIALVAGGAGTWLGMRADSTASTLVNRIGSVEQRVAKGGDAQQEVQKLSGGLDDLRKEVVALAAAAKAAPVQAQSAGADPATHAQIVELQRITENLAERLSTLTRGAATGGSEGGAAAGPAAAEVEEMRKTIAELRQQKSAADSQLHDLAKSVEELRARKPESAVDAELAALRKQMDGMSQELAALADAAKRAPKSAGVEVKPLPKNEPKPEVRVEPAEETAEVKPAPKESKSAPPAEPVAAAKPAAEPAKAGDAKPEAAPAPKGAFGINLLSTNSQKAAQQAQEKLRKEGIETFIRTAEIKGTTWYRLRAEGFANTQDAKKFLQEHQNHPEFNGAWVSKN